METETGKILAVSEYGLESNPLYPRSFVGHLSTAHVHGRAQSCMLQHVLKTSLMQNSHTRPLLHRISLGLGD